MAFQPPNSPLSPSPKVGVGSKKSFPLSFPLEKEGVFLEVLQRDPLP